MDTLGDILGPYSETIAKFAGTVTCLQFLSGVLLVKDICKKGSSDPYPIWPFLGGIILTVLSLKYGSMMGDPAMINVNIIGFAINVVFTVAFYWYASDEKKMRVWSNVGMAGIFIMAALIYANFEDPILVEFRFGMLITTILVILVGSPLLDLSEIIAKKSTEGLPFPIIVAGTVVSSSWMLYGLSIKNSVVAYQNAFLLFLGSIQLALFAIYPNTQSKLASAESSSPMKKTSKSKQSSPVKPKADKKEE